VYTFYTSHLAIITFFFLHLQSSLFFLLSLPPYVVFLDHYIFISPPFPILNVFSVVTQLSSLDFSPPPPPLAPLCLFLSLSLPYVIFLNLHGTLCKSFLHPPSVFLIPPLCLYFTHSLLSLIDLLFLSCSLLPLFFVYFFIFL